MVDLVGVELIRISIFPSVHRQVHYSLLKTFGGGLPQALSEVAWRWRIEGNELRERPYEVQRAPAITKDKASLAMETTGQTISQTPTIKIVGSNPIMVRPASFALTLRVLTES